ncbi:MAG: DUF2752 domain-containing protein, partial [Phycisphaerales bacterium]|nr:DUF2752 domain-containing protein [Phycisphaerales bacterium]
GCVVGSVMDQERVCIPVAAARGPQWQKRLMAAGLAVATGVVLAIAVVLTPDASGAGTHKQLGLPACNWISTVGMPCPTCGYTTSFTHAAHGDFVGAFVNQPFGAVLAIGTAVVFLGSIIVLLTGAPLGGLVARYWTAKWTWAVIGMVLLAWVYKILLFKELI